MQIFPLKEEGSWREKELLSLSLSLSLSWCRPRMGIFNQNMWNSSQEDTYMLIYW